MRPSSCWIRHQASSLDKLTWDVGVKMGDQVSKQATIGTILCFFSAPCDFFFFNLTSSFHSTILHFPIERSRNKDLKPLVPQLYGKHALLLRRLLLQISQRLGRAMTKVAVSVKDALPEMEELKPVSSNQTEEASDDDASHAET
ncbi:hypothetical protein NC653_025250 [Populus alba x Populus x berolinensis]|uniref:Uncharacterized protein n=1 Tax=Populus alba x Populus x berolinensis TaxID=444605 RepID=A0AAD6MD71_9ROSI|nr:hypothetical protein NC653_025250 [Populus alba x Populus x berolinensis]